MDPDPETLTGGRRRFTASSWVSFKDVCQRLIHVAHIIYETQIRFGLQEHSVQRLHAPECILVLLPAKVSSCPMFLNVK